MDHLPLLLQDLQLVGAALKLSTLNYSDSLACTHRGSYPGASDTGDQRGDPASSAKLANIDQNLALIHGRLEQSSFCFVLFRFLVGLPKQSANQQILQK